MSLSALPSERAIGCPNTPKESPRLYIPLYIIESHRGNRRAPPVLCLQTNYAARSLGRFPRSASPRLATSLLQLPRSGLSRTPCQSAASLNRHTSTKEPRYSSNSNYRSVRSSMRQSVDSSSTSYASSRREKEKSSVIEPYSEPAL